MPAADLIRAGAIDIYGNAFRRCRDNNITRDCQGYALDQIRANYPGEQEATYRAINNSGREAVTRANRINQGNGRFILNTWSPLDPSDTLYRAGNRGAIRYDYGVNVAIGVRNAQGTTFNLQRRILITASSPLSRSEIESDALAIAQGEVDELLSGSERLEGTTQTTTFDVRIEAAYRNRA